MRITAVIENNSNKAEILSQYGLSLFVESGGNSFLVDSGQDGSAFANFGVLGLSADKIGAVVVSHNHYDHIGGLQPFLDANMDAKLYISKKAKNEYYTKRPFRKRKLVSRNNLIEANAGRTVYVDDIEQVFENVFVCRIKNPDPGYQCRDKKLKQLIGGTLVPDAFEHEVYVAVLEEGECKIISSCSHNGIVNIIADAKRRFPDYGVSCFIGGLHFRGKASNTLNCKEAFVRQVFDKVNQSGLKRLYTCHCTGRKAFGIIKDISSAEVEYFSGGEVLTI